MMGAPGELVFVKPDYLIGRIESILMSEILPDTAIQYTVKMDVTGEVVKVLPSKIQYAGMLNLSEAIERQRNA